jgi:hypothetical protein
MGLFVVPGEDFDVDYASLINLRAMFNMNGVFVMHFIYPQIVNSYLISSISYPDNSIDFISDEHTLLIIVVITLNGSPAFNTTCLIGFC